MSDKEEEVEVDEIAPVEPQDSVGFASLDALSEEAAPDATPDEELGEHGSGIGLVEREALEGFTDIRDFIYKVMRREGLTDLESTAKFLEVSPSELEAAIGPTRELSKQLYLSVSRLPFLQPDDAGRLLDMLYSPEVRSVDADIKVGSSVSMEPTVNGVAGSKPLKYVPLPQKPKQWNDEALCRFIRYEARVFDLSKPDERTEYSQLLTEWKKGFSSFKVVGREVVFKEATKAIFLELEYYEFLDLETL